MTAKLVTLGAVMSIPVCAAAQSTGSRLPGASSAMVASTGMYDEGELASRPSDEAVAVGRRMAACLIETRRRPVIRYLSAASKPERQVSFKAIEPGLSSCLGPRQQRLQVAITTLEGALAEGLIGRGIDPLPSVTGPDGRRAGWFSDDPAQRVVQEMSVCVAERAPAQALTLVRSPPNTLKETQAFAGVMPVIGPCLIQGATLKANRASIRFTLANALYHRSVDTTPQSTATAVERK